MSRTHAQIVAELQDRWPEHRVAPSQARIRALCDLLGSPERSLPVILIAGTNGKGSTALMIDSLLRALGLLLAGAWTVWRPRSPFAVDGWLFAAPAPSDDPVPTNEDDKEPTR